MEPLIPQPIDEKEMRVAYSAGAPYSNRYVVTMHGPIARLAFLEVSADGNSQLRAAVTVATTDLLALAGLFESMARNAGVKT